MRRKVRITIFCLSWLCWFGSLAHAADRVVIGNVSRTVEQLPNYAATDKGFFAQEGIQGDVVLIGSTDTLIQALISGQVNVAIADPSAAINAVERGASLKIIGGTVPVAAYTLITCPKYKSIKELKGTTIGVVSLVSGSTIFLREMLKAEGLELNRDYPPLLQMEVLEAKAFEEKKKQLAKFSCASFRSENHCDSSTSETERWDSVLSPGVP